MEVLCIIEHESFELDSEKIHLTCSNSANPVLFYCFLLDFRKIYTQSCSNNEIIPYFHKNFPSFQSSEFAMIKKKGVNKYWRVLYAV